MWEIYKDIYKHMDGKWIIIVRDDMHTFILIGEDVTCILSATNPYSAITEANRFIARETLQGS